MPITITEAAKKKVSSLLRKRQTPEHYLKVSVQSGGCSGFMYNYEFIEAPNDSDKIFEFDDVRICIPKKSYILLNGMEIDYKEELLKSGLVFNVPLAQRSCGCGESISF
tara:strand:+ start:660 stop:986 length:327 start_codon:yes stop_codon:yes gene_type:complete